MNNMRKQLEKLTNIRGFIGASISNVDGVVVENIIMDPNIDSDRLSVIMTHALNRIKSATQITKLGTLDFIEIDTEDITTIIKCNHVKNIHFHLIIIINRHIGNPSTFKLMINEIIPIISNGLSNQNIN